MANVIVLITLGLTALVLFSPKVTGSPVWRATVTPLASIIGSGFLVSLPLLAHRLGAYAVLGMAFLVLLSYGLGAAIRFNILYAEPLFDERRSGPLYWLEETSHLALAFAYFISVTYYLTLLSAFLLKGAGTIDPVIRQGLTTVILAAIGLYGLLRDLHGLENIEEYAVGLKLAVIAAALAALTWFNLHLALNGTWRISHLTGSFDWTSMRVVLGLLIVVQGFETSRFLAGAYPPELRVRTMRYAQLISGAIYLAFFLLALVALKEKEVLSTEVTGITELLAPVASALPFLIIAGAVFAQLSAAVADAIGAGGLIEQSSRRRIDHRHAYPLIALMGVVLTWSLNIFGVIALASRAFALFYLLQCLVAARVALEAPAVTRRLARLVGFLVLAGFALAVVVLGIPAESI